MTTTRNLELAAILFLLLLVPEIGSASGYPRECTAWREIIVLPAERKAEVGKGTQFELGGGPSTSDDPLGVSSLSDQQKLAAIGCLLEAEGDLRPAAISGSTTSHSSQIFAPARAELAALYLTSYIFTDRYDHSLAVALRGEGASYSERGRYTTRPEAIKIAYVAYKKWFKELKRIGLCKARERRLDPLAGTGLSWY